MSLDWMSLAAIAVAALAVGLLVGTTSVGGVMLVPALIFWGGLGVHQAAATVLASSIFTGALGAWLYSRRGSFEWRMVWPLCVGAVPAGYAGALLASQVDAGPLGLIIGVLIVAAGALILRPPPALSGGRGRSRLADTAVLLGIGTTAGFGSGLSGAGGPIFSTPMMMVMRFAPLAAIGASQGMMILASVSGSAAHLLTGAIVPDVLLLITVGQLIGVAAGVGLAHSLPTAMLRKLAAWMCVAAGALMVIRAVA
ncbi:MAG: sulfite exporter TauE/SafE family protein [Burkholderiales bacterium]